MKHIKLYEQFNEMDPYDEEIWDDEYYKKMFIQFLKDNDAYEKFMINFEKGTEWRRIYIIFGSTSRVGLDEFFEEINPTSYLGFAFGWSGGNNEGFHYWDDMNAKWVNFLRNGTREF